MALLYASEGKQHHQILKKHPSTYRGQNTGKPLKVFQALAASLHTYLSEKYKSCKPDDVPELRTTHVSNKMPLQITRTNSPWRSNPKPSS